MTVPYHLHVLTTPTSTLGVCWYYCTSSQLAKPMASHRVFGRGMGVCAFWAICLSIFQSVKMSQSFTRPLLHLSSITHISAYVLWRIILHPIGAHGLISWWRNSLVCSPSLLWNEGQKPKTEFTTSMTITWTISSHVSSCLAICRPQHASVHCSAMTAAHKDHVVLASNAQQPEI